MDIDVLDDPVAIHDEQSPFGMAFGSKDPIPLGNFAVRPEIAQ
jgi:hypothetical protein